uniref:SFRICE_012033 n=1 Tax=Spodoptera frugiperda TaxID=7108 RepID=A0A2H1VWP7_SPOFR
MASNRRRPWTLETPEALQVRCRLFGVSIGGGDCLPSGDTSARLPACFLKKSFCTFNDEYEEHSSDTPITGDFLISLAVTEARREGGDNELVTPLVFQASIGGGDCLPSGDPIGKGTSKINEKGADDYSGTLQLITVLRQIQAFI